MAEGKPVTGPAIVSLIRSGKIQFTGVVGFRLKFAPDGDPVLWCLLTSKTAPFRPSAAGYASP
jgi:hypothetical protein